MPHTSSWPRPSPPGRTLSYLACATLVAALALLATPSKPVAAASTVTVVMSGLDNPRGLAFGPQGALYVAEAGRGGDGPCFFLRGGTRCYGATGAVSRLWRGEQARIATGLPSHAPANGAAAIGPMDISMNGVGNAYITVGFQTDPGRRVELGTAAAGFARLLRLTASGGWRYGNDLGAYEAEANPDGNLIDSNPFGLLQEAGSLLLTDAGGNSLLRVDANGDVSTIATFPSRPARDTDSVPTTVAAGPDGAYYVGELTGQPFAPGASNIYRVVAGEAPTVLLSGFKSIIDIAFASDGTLYVLEHSSGPAGLAAPGSLIRVEADGARSTLLGGLDHPTSVVVGPDGALYISNRGQSAAIGEVLRVVA